MVTIKAIQWNSFNGRITPIQHSHNLKCKKSAPTFDEGETVLCSIMKYDNGRYAVFSSSGVSKSKYHVFESVEELHEHFDEL